MATSTQSEVNRNLLSCPICLETLQSPKILPCLHTFCEKCMSDYIVAIGHKAENKISEFTCPVCRTVVKPRNATDRDIEKWASLLPNNAIILTMIAEANGDKQKCHVCNRQGQQSDAKFWCKECDEAFCDKCLSMHNLMKILSAHSVLPIENLASNLSGIDLNAITGNCCVHPTQYVEAYCSNHEALCCILCVTLDHKECKSVTANFELTESDNQEGNQEKTLTDIQDAVHKLLKIKEKQKSDFKTSTENTEEDAAKFLELVKCKLDDMFQAFTKQLHVFRDEKITDLNIRIRLLEQFITCMDHWKNSYQVVKEYGTQLQTFIHMHTVKQQIKASVQELIKTCKNDYSIGVKFEKNEYIDQMKTLDQIGQYSITRDHLVDQMTELCNICRDFGVQPSLTFENIKVEKVKRYHFPKSNLKCGVCVSNDYVILGDEFSSSQRNLHLFNKKIGSIKMTRSFKGDVKRLCYNKEYKYLFISCYNKELFRAVLLGENFEEPQKMFNSQFVGGLCVYHDYIYVIVDNGINKFISTARPDSSSQMELCFPANTNCGLNGMKICDARIYYTTINDEIKCVKLNGEEIFCFKNDAIKTPECITVLNSGLVLVVARANKGSLHVVCSNGTKHRTLLTNFENITDPRDVWLDEDEETLYIAGGEYLEVFKLTVE